MERLKPPAMDEKLFPLGKYVNHATKSLMLQSQREVVTYTVISV